MPPKMMLVVIVMLAIALFGSGCTNFHSAPETDIYVFSVDDAQVVVRIPPNGSVGQATVNTTTSSARLRDRDTFMSLTLGKDIGILNPSPRVVIVIGVTRIQDGLSGLDIEDIQTTIQSRLSEPNNSIKIVNVGDSDWVRATMSRGGSYSTVLVQQYFLSVHYLINSDLARKRTRTQQDQDVWEFVESMRISGVMPASPKP